MRSNANSQHHPGTTLLDAVVPVGQHLNPDWVETLMLWPVGWTRLGLMNPQMFRAWQQEFETALLDCVP